MGYSKKLYNILGGLQVCIIAMSTPYVHTKIEQTLQKQRSDFVKNKQNQTKLHILCHFVHKPFFIMLVQKEPQTPDVLSFPSPTEVLHMHAIRLHAA